MEELELVLYCIFNLTILVILWILMIYYFVSTRDKKPTNKRRKHGLSNDSKKR